MSAVRHQPQPATIEWCGELIDRTIRCRCEAKVLGETAVVDDCDEVLTDLYAFRAKLACGPPPGGLVNA